MKVFFTVLICKLAHFIGSLFGKGSSMPGGLALKICPDILSRLHLPKTIVAVTGSNGKTSTVEMIVACLEADGKKVVWNKEGSNQTQGVVTMLLSNATLGGKVNCDCIVLETDERYARLTFKNLKPTHFVILNILRDQMTRNGHPEFICSKIAEAVSKDINIIANADDPLVMSITKDCSPKLFGFNPDAYNNPSSVGMYNDGTYCPVCGGKMEYTYKIMGVLGGFQCSRCGFKRPSPDYSVNRYLTDSGTVIINDGTEHQMKCGIDTVYHAYNMLAAFTVCRELGVKAETIESVISDYFLHNGRIRCWSYDKGNVVLLTSKHENSTSYDWSLEYVSRKGGDVLIIVDAVSRKYFTSETSWLWDINFSELASPNVGTIYISGKYVWDIAQRLDYSGIDSQKIEILDNLDDITHIIEKNKTNLYVVTCFSDRDKFISRMPSGASEQRSMPQ